MSEILISIAALVALAVGLIAPVLLAMQITKARPQWSGWLVTALSALPTGAPFLIFAAWIAATTDITPCAEPPCESFASLWFDVMLILGLLALLVGFGLAWAGRIAQLKRAK